MSLWLSLISLKQLIYTYEAETLEFHPLSYTDMSNIEFILTKSDGYPIPFTERANRYPISLTLLFRPRLRAAAKRKL